MNPKMEPRTSFNPNNPSREPPTSDSDPNPCASRHDLHLSLHKPPPFLNREPPTFVSHHFHDFASHLPLPRLNRYPLNFHCGLFVWMLKSHCDHDSFLLRLFYFLVLWMFCLCFFPLSLFCL